MNTPEWLSDNKSGGGDALAQGNDATISNPMATSVTPSALGASAASSNAADASDDPPDLPGVILMMRLMNMGVAGLLIAVSILQMTPFPSPSALVLGIYATCGGLLICCLETQLKFVRVIIAVNFGFLFNSAWRFLFYLLLGSVALSYGGLFGTVTALAFVIVAVFNSYVLCRYPSYRRMREKIAEEEDKRIEARISKEVKKQAARQLMK